MSLTVSVWESYAILQSRYCFRQSVMYVSSPFIATRADVSVPHLQRLLWNDIVSSSSHIHTHTGIGFVFHDCKPVGIANDATVISTLSGLLFGTAGCGDLDLGVF